MGIPELKIAFKEHMRKPITDIGVGKVLLILKDKVVTTRKEYTSYESITEKFSKDNLKLLELCFIGNVQDVRVTADTLESKSFTPEKLITYSVTDAITLDKLLTSIENEDFDFICMPEATEEDNAKLLQLIKKLKGQNKECFAVISTNKTSNSEDVIEVDIDEFTDLDGTKYTKAMLLSYVTGICAGTPLDQAITYATLDNLSNIPAVSESDANGKIDNGKVILIKRGGKVRIARGVTSFTSDDSKKKGDAFKSIKEVRIYKYINNAITSMLVNFYVGKVANSYRNKLILIAEIKEFLKKQAFEELIENGYTVDIDVKEQAKYLKTKGIDIKTLNEQAIREHNTDNKVFLTMGITSIDSMEDFVIETEV